ncbi:FAD/NAD(P)-binding oxidoreductase [Streptomyces dengpaensis]|uniref:FAD/NAD(P)-binding oxidoreductase n=1 Tax=Streptomyces dengpaensis TaxID=2049881 RepID=UPI0030B7F584
MQTASELRAQGWKGRITLLGEEAHLPYDRAPVSKELLTGAVEASTFEVDWWAIDIQLLLGRRALGFESGPAAGVRPHHDGGSVEADHLMLATGAVPLTPPGVWQETGVHLLRTVEDTWSSSEPAGSEPRRRPRPGCWGVR